jgi:hypothetical protein
MTGKRKQSGAVQHGRNGERDVSPVRTGNPIIAAVTGDIYREAG